MPAPLVRLRAVKFSQDIQCLVVYALLVWLRSLLPGVMSTSMH